MALRLNTTVTSLNLGWNNLGEGEGRALSEALPLNTTVTSFDLSYNFVGEEVRSAPGQAWDDSGGSLESFEVEAE